MINWTSEKRRIEELIPAPYNPRQLTEKQAEDLDRSLTSFNLADPIVINKNNTIIGGHQRINILKQKGISDVDVRVPDRELSEKEEKELNLRLNKNLGEWDFDQLANFDEEMLLDVGFDPKELDSIFQLEPDEKDDEVPEVPEEPTTKPGDIYLLGRHRLMCGDSTKVEDVEKLMDGKKADMVFTDPPYGISWNTDYSNLAKGSARHCRNAFKKIANDDVEFDPNLLFSLSEIVLCFGANYYSDKLPCGGWIVWDKAHETGKFLFSNAEGAWTNKINAVRVFRHKWQGHDKASERGVKTLHPTQKPVQLISDILQDIFKDIKSVVDPFLGSGSTLIACEKTNRICYGMELDPKYCDVIVKRWEDYTGGKATCTNR